MSGRSSEPSPRRRGVKLLEKNSLDVVHIHRDEPELGSEVGIPHLPFSEYHPPRTLEESHLLDNGSGVPRIGRNPIFIHGDERNVMLLLFLYVLQGIPLGLAGAMPLLLQHRHISYAEQALFSFVFWPFSLKLLWAPIVDSVYWAQLGGLRKSWLIPTQYAIAGFMLILSYNTSVLLGDSDGGNKPQILFLTTLFFMLNFLAATQDIAVDGWALTMLHPDNVGYASTCNTVGQTAGYFLGNILFLTLESADFANAYLRSEPLPHGVVTLSGFLFFWGIVFGISTTLILLMKKENPEAHENASGIIDTYKLLWAIIKKYPVKKFITIVLTMKIAFAAADSVSGLKLVEFGVPKEKLVLLAIPMIPIQIILPWLISRRTSGDRPLDLLLKAYPYRLFMGVIFTMIVYFTPSLQVTSPEGSTYYPGYYYILLVLVYALHQVTLYCMFVSSMAFNARISDPLIGGTYMTLLNTVNNLGGNWPSTVALSAVDTLTFSTCDEEGKNCTSWLDGYYLESAICTIIGILWIRKFKRHVVNIQDLDRDSWKVNSQGT